MAWQRKHLDADGVADAAEELEVRAVQLPRALAAPQEVAAAVVPALAASSCWFGDWTNLCATQSIGRRAVSA